jgi:hypothetical protein
MELKIPYAKQEMLDQIRKDGIMLQADYEDDGIYVSVALPEHRITIYENYIDQADLN